MKIKRVGKKEINTQDFYIGSATHDFTEVDEL